jgi:site-specific DNA-cytosine methylase
MADASYSFDKKILLAADHGVPQRRQRLVCAAVREDLLDVPREWWRFPWPAATRSGPRHCRKMPAITVAR